MNKKDELQAQRNELSAHSEDTLDRIKELDKEIKAVIDEKPEDTYSIGDRFKGHCNGSEHSDEYRSFKAILITNGKPEVVMADIGNGERWVGTITKVKTLTAITQSEFNKITAGYAGGMFTRYWDNAKKTKVEPESKGEKSKGEPKLRQGDYNIKYGLLAHVLKPLQGPDLLHWRNHKGVWNAPNDDNATVDGNIYDDLANRDKKIDGFRMEKAGLDLDVSLLLNGIIMIREVQSGDDIFFEPKELAEFIAQCQQVLNGLKN